MAGLAAGCVVMTADGALPVEHLCEGDRVVTRAGFVRVARIRVSRGVAEVADVAPSALGHGRPAEAMTFAADQPVLVRDWRARAMFGAAPATVAVGRLADDALIRRRRAEVRLYEIILDRAAVMQAGGIEVFCAAETVPA